MAFCEDRHEPKIVAEKGKTPYLSCKQCGYTKLIPGVEPGKTSLLDMVKILEDFR